MRRILRFRSCLCVNSTSHTAGRTAAGLDRSVFSDVEPPSYSMKRSRVAVRWCLFELLEILG